MLLEQGRELMQFKVAAAGGPSLLADTHIILARQDNMVDVPSIQELIEEAQLDDYDVVQHILEGSHLVELDDPQAVVEVITRVWQRVFHAQSLPRSISPSGQSLPTTTKKKPLDHGSRGFFIQGAMPALKRLLVLTFLNLFHGRSLFT